ncbi:unnamed protein product [Paramecium sonneborni]|uniref:Uncharacterized protein n=1 Tax=Paramecium sonneborni TaxID=65129 RepID=A0A8S1RRN2_9CILI|nr:unnamed protein product [Paramecium sonneborni]
MVIWKNNLILFEESGYQDHQLKIRQAFQKSQSLILQLINRLYLCSLEKNIKHHFFEKLIVFRQTPQNKYSSCSIVFILPQIGTKIRPTSFMMELCELIRQILCIFAEIGNEWIGNPLIQQQLQQMAHYNKIRILNFIVMEQM